MANIKEVARLAGVSTSTVSRALTGNVPVRESTRERIMQAVRELDYSPNPMARGLKEGCSHILALVIPDIINPFFPKLVKCVERAAIARGYSLIFCDSGNDEAQELRHLESMRSHYVDGVLFVSVADGTQGARMLRDSGVPVVVVNRDFDAGVPCITNDNYVGAHTMVEYLIRQGHRRICCMAPPLRAQHYLQRQAGCLDALRAHGLDGADAFAHDVMTVEDAYLRTRQILSAPGERPTAFFVFIDTLAAGVYSGAHDCGLSVPGDVSVAGFDNISISQHMIPSLTTYEHPVEQITALAVERLLALAAGDDTGYEKTEVSGTIIVRKSVKRMHTHAEDQSV